MSNSTNLNSESDCLFKINDVLKEFDELYLEHINDNNFKIKEEIIKGMVDNMSVESIYDYIANTCATYISKEPNFNKLAVLYELKGTYLSMNINSVIKIDLYDFQYNYNLISELYYNFIINNYDKLINIIDIERDKLIDFFGIKTLQRSYLLKDKNNNLLETPQMMFLRCAIQIHFNSDDNIELDNIKFNLIKETYDNMSQLYFTHATPTLFNSGGRYPQLSSCYLLQCPDDLSSISKSISDMMMISKWAGGIGVNLTDIRANGSLIKSNGGKSTGIIPLCKVLESVARYINQCHSKDTLVYSRRGVIKVEEVSIDDELITKNGTFQKVLGISSHIVNKDLLKIKVTHSFEPSLVTEEHQIYAITGQSNILNYSIIKNRLIKEIIKPEFISASELKEGDLMGFPIPRLIIDSVHDEEFFRFYGIIIGLGSVYKLNQDNIIFEIVIEINKKEYLYNFIINFLINRDIEYLVNLEENNKIINIKWQENVNKLPITYNDIYDENNDKIIKSEFLHLPKNKTLAILKGLLESSAYYSGEIYLNIYSKSLAYSLKYIFLRLGILISGYFKLIDEADDTLGITNSIYEYIIKIPKHFNLYSIYGNKIEYSSIMNFTEYNNILWTRIKSIGKEYYNDMVYDFNMENNHNYTTDMGLVHNSGKRQGSIAVYIEPWHYDIFDFIDLRKNTGDENLRARDLFLGLWVPNAFMRAVEKDDDWYLMTPDVSTGLTEIHSEDFDNLYYKYVEEGKYVKKIKALELYKKILESQLETGMPYMLYKDHANNKSNQKNLGTIKNSNLCVAPETKILTDKGYIEI